MAVSSFKIVSQLVVESLGFSIVRTDIAGTPEAITLVDGDDYYIIGDGDGTALLGPDLLEHIQAVVRAASAELATFAIGVTDAGLVQLSMGAGKTATITWGAGGTTLRDWLRLSGVTQDLTDDPTAAQGTYIHQGGYYPNAYRCALEDLPSDEPAVSQSMVDDGSEVYTIGWAEPTAWRLRIRAKGFPYSLSGRNEFHAMRSLMQHLSRGYKFRYYRDASVATAYDEGDNPRGYHTLTLDAESVGWAPAPVVGNIYNQFEKSLRAWG